MQYTKHQSCSVISIVATRLLPLPVLAVCIAPSEEIQSYVHSDILATEKFIVSVQ